MSNDSGMIKLPIRFDDQRLREEIAAAPSEWWNADRIRTTHVGSPHVQVEDMLLRFNERQLTKESALNDTETVALEPWRGLSYARNCALDLARYLSSPRIGRVMLTRLVDGGRIYPHKDEGTPAWYYDRYHLVVGSGPGKNWFRTDQQWEDMRPGEIWWVNNQREHEVINESGEDRLHLIVDLRLDK